MLANVQLDKKKFLLSQLFILFLGSLITFSIFGLVSAISYTLGGLVVFCANFIFFIRMFMKKQFDPGVEILIFYMSEMFKLTIVIVATILLAIYVKPELFPYIFGLISLQLVMCFVPMFFKKVR
jgi:F0F1-type ATP synthase assembly protein I